MGALCAGIGCRGLYEWVLPEPGAEHHPVDFASALEFAERAEAAYGTAEEIEQRYASLRPVVRRLPDSEVQYFIIFDDATGTQHIAIRGTSNLANVKVDAQFDPVPDTLLGVHFHSGFAVAARQLYDDLRPRLNKGYRTTVTGHSLGGALAVIIGLYLQHEEFRVTAVRTFGQPKVTSVSGALTLRDFPLIRFVNRADPVADVPPSLPSPDWQWLYSHFGPEVLLWTDQHYIYLDKQQSPLGGIASFWSNLGEHSVDEHKMERYLASLRSKIDGAQEVPFADREKFSVGQ